MVLSTLLVANLASLAAARLALGRLPLCVIRETTTIGARLAQGGVFGHVRLALARWIYPLADIIIAPSQGVAGDLVEIVGLPPDKVHVSSQSDHRCGFRREVRRGCKPQVFQRIMRAGLYRLRSVGSREGIRHAAEGIPQRGRETRECPPDRLGRRAASSRTRGHGINSGHINGS